MAKKSNWIVEIFLFPVLLIKYFFLGIKVLFFDVFKAVFKPIKQVNKTQSDEKLVLLQKKLEDSLNKVEKNPKGTTHIYKYVVKDSEDNIIRGKSIGKSLNEVYTFLQSEYAEVYDVRTSFLIDAFYKETNIGSTRLSNKNLIFLLTQLSTYLKAGLTLNEAIKILCHQMKMSKTQLQAMQSIYYDLNLGESFSTSLEHQKKIFPSLLINMVRAAEASGTLVETLDDMADYYTEIDSNRKQMINAISYPLIIMLFSIFVIIFIMTYLVPQFENIYAHSDAPVTGLTKTLIETSNYMKTHIFGILTIFFVLVAVIILGYKTNRTFRRIIQSIFMRVPIIKNIIIYNEISIFAKTFASLLKNNVYITDSMDLLGRITNNEIYKEIFKATIDNIVKGEKISDAFKSNWAVPDVAYYMIVTGEDTGELQQMMEKVSDYYRAQHKSLVNNFRTFIEPILIILLAGIVGAIIISVVIPMFDIYSTIK